MRLSKAGRRQSAFILSLVWIFISVLPVSPALGSSRNAFSRLSAFGLTEHQFENRVKEYIGIPYRRGGTSSKGMDCSGFVRTVYDRLFDIRLPYTARAQFSFSAFEKIDTREMQPGDLIFFATKKRKRINHVGVYISDRQFIHASTSQGVTISSLDEQYWKKRFVGSKRHTSMNSRPESDTFRIAGTLEIPVFENGLIRVSAQEDYGFDSLMTYNGFSSYDTDSLEMDDLNYSDLFLHQISYGHMLFDGFDVTFSAIHEKFDVWEALHGVEPTDVLYASLPDTAERMGLRLASDFRPSSWLSIIPSVTYFDYSTETEALLNVPDWSFGLDTHFAPMSKRWTVSLLLQYSEGENLTTLISPYAKFSSMDMALKLSVHLTDSFQFHIMGKHDMRTGRYGLSEDAFFMQSATSDLFMMFDFTY